MTSRWTQAKMTQLAEEERRALDLGPMDPLDPYRLCEEYGIPVYDIEDLEPVGCPRGSVEHFLENSSKWSAALVPVGSGRLIIENTANDPARRRSNIAHEMSHLLLEHEFRSMLLGDDHERIFDAKAEKEALFLSGELLVPAAACRKMAFAGWDNAQVSALFGVSAQFAQMRMKGVRVMASRALRKQARSWR